MSIFTISELYEEEKLTTSNAVDLVLNKEVDEGDKSAKESTSKVLAVLDSGWVRRAKGNTASCPRESGDDV